MRQLVELQLCHSAEIKAIIDRAWGVIHNKHKKAETTPAPPPANDPHSQENLQLQPLGQDKDRKRYWAVDGPCTISSPSARVSLFACICAIRRDSVSLLSAFCGFIILLRLT